MKPEVQARVLELFGVPVCSICCGTGEVEGERVGVIVGGDCPRCEGVGRTLKDATLWEWPWWRTERESTVNRCPRMPDLLKSVVATGLLLERMAKFGQVNVIIRLDECGDVSYSATWELDDPDGGWQTIGGHWLREPIFGGALTTLLDQPELGQLELRLRR